MVRWTCDASEYEFQAAVSMESHLGNGCSCSDDKKFAFFVGGATACVKI